MNRFAIVKRGALWPWLAEHASWPIILGAPLVYWLVSRQYTGPTFLTDEIGYLSNAAFLAGHQLDAASSTHAGYSLFLVPLFRFLSDPAQVWQGVMLVNAFFWAGTFFLLDRFLTLWKPGIRTGVRVTALLFAALYPAWLTMAGYALTTTALVFFFMASILTLAHWKPGNVVSLIPHSICVGFLWWIHPTGLGAVAASFVVVSVVGLRSRDWRSPTLHGLILIALIAGYGGAFQPWLLSSMTPPGYQPLISYESLGTVAGRAMQGTFWLRLGALTGGQLLYLIAGSLGVCLFALVTCARMSYSLVSRRKHTGSPARSRMALYMIGTVVLVAGIGSLSISEYITRIDQWIFGRYVDAVALPLIAAGFVSLGDYLPSRRLKWGAGAAAVLVAAGLALARFGTYSSTISIPGISAFWPQYVVAGPDFAKWMVMAAAAMIVVAIGGRTGALLLMAGSLLLSAPRQAAYHQDLLAWDARPSSIVDLIRDNYAPGACIGYDQVGIVDPADFVSLRFQLYKFYLFNYHYRRMTPDEWLAGCDGPLLTPRPDRLAGDSGITIVAREDFSSLFLVTRSNGVKLSVPESIRTADDLFLARPDATPCLFAGCFSMTSSELRHFTEVGRLSGGQIQTTGRPGAVVFGPYYALKKGAYHLLLRGDFTAVQDVHVDVVSDQAQVHATQVPLCPYALHGKEQLVIPFALDRNASDLQIRIWVSASDQIAVSGYDVILAQGQPPPRKPPGLCAYGAQLSGIPRQVGLIQPGEIASNRIPGFLTLGPYAHVAAGTYRLVVDGTVEHSRNAWVAVTANNGTREFARFPVSGTQASRPGAIAGGTVMIDAPVDDLEIRVHVGPQDDIRISGYKFLPVPP